MNQYFNSDALKNKIPKHIGQIMPNNIDISDINFQFNTVMKQLSFGMSVDSFIAEHPIKEWVEFTSTYTNTQGNKYYNIDLSYQYSNEVYLIENYDFIIINNNSVTAFDWSTSKAQDTKWLENAWKTKLRLFLLPENFAIKCENISLLYLFPNSKETCQIWYSLKQHKANFKTIGSTVNSAISKPVTEKIPVMENQYYHTAWLTETSVKEDFDAIPEIQL